MGSAVAWGGCSDGRGATPDPCLPPAHQPGAWLLLPTGNAESQHQLASLFIPSQGGHVLDHLTFN